MANEIEIWWQQVEAAGDAAPAGSPVWLANLTLACRAELRFETAEAGRLLKSIDPDIPQDAWRNVAALIGHRLHVREARGQGLPALDGEILAFIQQIPADQRSTLARAWHLRGVLAIRLGNMELAELAHVEALRLIETGNAMNWILDGLGQAFVARGAWEEARKTFLQVIAKKVQAKDVLGDAISTGNLARLELRLGNPRECLRLIQETLARCGSNLAPASIVRLRTLLVEALLETGPTDVLHSEAVELESVLKSWGNEPHYLKGFAGMTLARCAIDREGIDHWLKSAEQNFSLADQLALLRAWEAKLKPEMMEQPGWWEGMQKRFAASDLPTEAEVTLNLILAEQSARQGRKPEMQKHLQDAASCAARANNHLLLRRCDDLWTKLDPEGFADQLTHRFAGRSLAELEQLCKEEVTIIFCDLVNFTGRVLDMAPVEVLAEMRSLFELSAPLFVRYRIRPIQHQGDGLLAVAEGENHMIRGLQFARDLVARTERVTAVRKALGSRWSMQTRAGVASGAVVMGALGTYFKREFLAIGPAVNLAARLEANAEPGQVLCLKELADAAGITAVPAEQILLKGFPTPLAIVRL